MVTDRHLNNQPILTKHNNLLKFEGETTFCNYVSTCYTLLRIVLKNTSLAVSLHNYSEFPLTFAIFVHLLLGEQF